MALFHLSCPSLSLFPPFSPSSPSFLPSTHPLFPIVLSRTPVLWAERWSCWRRLSPSPQDHCGENRGYGELFQRKTGGWGGCRTINISMATLQMGLVSFTEFQMNNRSYWNKSSLYPSAQMRTYSRAKSRNWTNIERIQSRKKMLSPKLKGRRESLSGDLLSGISTLSFILRKELARVWI